MWLGAFPTIEIVGWELNRPVGTKKKSQGLTAWLYRVAKLYAEALRGNAGAPFGRETDPLLSRRNATTQKGAHDFRVKLRHAILAWVTAPPIKNMRHNVTPQLFRSQSHRYFSSTWIS